MKIKQKIRLLIHAFQKFIKNENKKLVIKKIYFILRDDGIQVLKNKIVDISVNHSALNTQEDSNPLSYEVNYLHEQDAKVDRETMRKELKEMKTDTSVAIYILATEATVDLNGVLASIKSQIYPNYSVTIVKIGNLECVRGIDKDSKLNIQIVDLDEMHLVSEFKTLISKCQKDYILFLEPDSILLDYALLEYIKVIDNCDVDVVYSDSCIMDPVSAKPIDYKFLPDYSPIHLLHRNYIGNDFIVKSEVLKSVAKGMSAYGTYKTYLYELLIDLSQGNYEFCHIEQMLALKNSMTLVKDTEIDIANNKYMLEKYFDSNEYTINYSAHGYSYEPNMPETKVSVVVPVDKQTQIKATVSRMRNYFTYSNFEIVIVGHAIAISEFEESKLNSDKIKFVNYVGEGENYSQKCNKGAKFATGNILIFLQDNFESMNPHFLEYLIGCFVNEKVGAVSPKIIRADETIQYAGMVSGAYGLQAMPFNGERNEFVETHNEPAFMTRDVSILSGSCIAVRTELFNEIQGFNSLKTPNKYSNIDISFRIRQHGYQCVYCSNAVLKCNNVDWYDSWYFTGDACGFSDIVTKWSQLFSRDSYFTEPMTKKMLKNVSLDARTYVKNSKCESVKTTGKKILLVSHDMTITGAPVALLNAAKAIKENGDTPVLIAPRGGGLISQALEDGIITIIDPLVDIPLESMNDQVYSNMISIIKSFDLVLVSTLVMYRLIAVLNKTDVPVIWWVHEAKKIYDLGMADDIPETLNDNISVYCGGDYAKDLLIKHRPSYNVGTLLYAVPDTSKNVICSKKHNNKITFAIIGTIEHRKGQDIFVEAINSLSPDMIEKSNFYFIGISLHKKIFDKIKDLQEKYPDNVKYIEEVPHEVLLKLYEDFDCIICASRDDPMPVFITEAMMLSKLCICSEFTGTAKLLSDGINGFVYQNNNPDNLAEKMANIIENNSSMEVIRENSRKTYEKHFTTSVFNKNITELVTSVIENQCNSQVMEAIPTMPELVKKEVQSVKKLEILNEQIEGVKTLLLNRDLSTNDSVAEFVLIMIIKDGFDGNIDKTIESLKRQVYTKWTLSIVDHRSNKIAGQRPFQNLHKNVHYILPISSTEEAIYDYISMLSEKAYVLTIEPGDLLREDALYWFNKEVCDNKNAEIIYSDEALIEQNGEIRDVIYKPHWSPVKVVLNCYMGNLTAARVSVFRKTKFQKNDEFSMIYNLVLRNYSEIICKHINRVLFFRKADQKDEVRHISDNVQFGSKIRIMSKSINEAVRPTFTVIAPISNWNDAGMLIRNLSELSESGHEVIIIATEVNAQLNNLKGLDSVKVIERRYKSEIEAIRIALPKATGRVLVYMSEAVEVCRNELMSKLEDVFLIPGIGGVSPVVVDQDGRIEYAGISINHRALGIVAKRYYRHSHDDVKDDFAILKFENTSVLSNDLFAVDREFAVKTDLMNFSTDNMELFNLELGRQLFENGLYGVCILDESIIKRDDSIEHCQKDKYEVGLTDIVLSKSEFYSNDRYLSDEQCRLEYFSELDPFIIRKPTSQNEKSILANILMVTHQLSRSGLPIVLLDSSKVLIDAGYSVTVLSPVQGPLMEEFSEVGATVIIDKSLHNWHGHPSTEIEKSGLWRVDRIIEGFDLIIAGCIANYNLISHYNGSNIPVIWWLHDGYHGLHHIGSVMPKSLKNNIRVYCGGKYVQKALLDNKFLYDTQLLNYGVEDAAKNVKNIDKSKVRFVTVASIERRKGQDILVDALRYLPDEYHEKAEFIFMGDVVDESVYKQIEEICAIKESCTYIKSMSRASLFELYQSIDCVISPSRDDPMPVVMTEAMMLSKLCICSSATGTAEYINDGVSGFVFRSEDVMSLVNAIKFSIDNPKQISEIGKAARQVYIENFEMSIFEHNLLKIVEQTLDDNGQRDVRNIM